MLNCLPCLLDRAGKGSVGFRPWTGEGFRESYSCTSLKLLLCEMTARIAESAVLQCREDHSKASVRRNER